ncbi:MAG: hypothetical protein LBI87_11790 [Candidatus Accumulibacter sp.]|nr:hypothetical protein [Accumulibacter sp.]
MKKSRSTSNVKPLVHPQIVDDLTEFERNKTLDAFLALLTKAVQMPFSSLYIFESWRKHRAEVDLGSSWEKVSIWISRLDLRSGLASGSSCTSSSNSGDDPASALLHPHEIDALAKAAADAFLSMADRATEKESRMQDASFAYNMFLAAWPFADQLDRYPSIQRSAQFINRFVRLLFSAKPEPAPQKIVVRIEILSFIQFVATDFLDAVFKAEQAKIPESAKFRRDSLMLIARQISSILLLLAGNFRLTDSQKYPPGFTLKSLALLLDHLPKALKARLIVQIADDLHEETAGEGDYPPAVEPLRYLLDPMLNSPDTPVEAFPPLVGALRHSDATEYLGIDFVKEVLARFSERLRDLRGNGMFTMDCQQAYFLCDDISSINNCHYDEFLSMDLAILMAPACIPSSNVFNNDEPLDYYYYGDGDEYGQARSEWYFRVCREAISEGYWELANACLAFFLFSQPYLCNGRLLSDWRLLAELLKSGLGLLGENAVRDAARIALGVIRERGLGDGLDALNLEGWASEFQLDTEDVKQDQDAIDKYHQAVGNLQKAIGRENWFFLSIDAKRSLTAAEKSWVAMSSELGYGNNDLGQIAMGYVKAIELELTSRYQFLLNSSAYGSYFHEKYGQNPDPHLTLGSVTTVLRDYPRLPVNLQQEIENTGLSLHLDTGLVKHLWGLKNVRNKGAHTTEIGDEEIIKLRTNLFKNGIFKRFVEALRSPRRLG